MKTPSRAPMLALAIVLALPLVLPAQVGAQSPTWPDLEDAVVRPGVKIRLDRPTGSSYCTSNFVFRNPSSGQLYLGLAGHCVGGDLGAVARLASDTEYVERRAGLVVSNGPVIGTIAYSSWYYEGTRTEPCVVAQVPLSCSNGVGNGDNDFALIKLNSNYAPLTHPAVLHFGGPTGLATGGSYKELDKILTYGNSPLRPGPGPEDWHEGYIDGWDTWTVYGYTVGPGVPGDSGSEVLLGDGRALGVLVTLAVFPPGENGIARLDAVLDFANDRGMNVELQTWSLLDGGLLPSL